MTAIPIITIITLFLQQIATKIKCHKFCVFAAACTVSLSSFTGFALREIISVHLSVLAQTSGLHMGVLHAVTTCGPVLLEDKSQGVQGKGRSGTGRKWRKADYLPCTSPEFHLRPSFGFQREGRRGKRQNHGLEKEGNLLGSGPSQDISSFAENL